MDPSPAQPDPGVRLLVGHAWENRETAEEAAAICAELGIECLLDDRRDWIREGVRRLDEEATHLLVIVGAESRRSWWMAFQLGRAAERGLPVYSLSIGAADEPPAFLRGTTSVADLAELRRVLTAIRDASRCEPGER